MRFVYNAVRYIHNAVRFVHIAVRYEVYREGKGVFHRGERK